MMYVNCYSDGESYKWVFYFIIHTVPSTLNTQDKKVQLTRAFADERRSLFFNYLGELWKSSIVLLKDGSWNSGWLKEGNWRRIIEMVGGRRRVTDEGYFKWWAVEGW